MSERHAIRVHMDDRFRLTCSTCGLPVGYVTFVAGAGPNGEGRLVSFMRHYGSKQ